MEIWQKVGRSGKVIFSFYIYSFGEEIYIFLDTDNTNIRNINMRLAAKVILAMEMMMILQIWTFIPLQVVYTGL
jgi:hypothetical protein